MSTQGPLDHPALRAVDALLDQRQLEAAQQRLAELGQAQGLDLGVTYLATRLLFLRGKLQVKDVADRLRDIVRTTERFPEAERLLDAAESGMLTRTSGPPKPEAPSDALPLQAEPVAAAETDSSPPTPLEPSSPLPFLSGPADSLRARTQTGLGQVLPHSADAEDPLELPRAPEEVSVPQSSQPPRVRSSLAMDSSKKLDSWEASRLPSRPKAAVVDRTSSLGALDAFRSSAPPELEAVSGEPAPEPQGELELPRAPHSDSFDALHLANEARNTDKRTRQTEPKSSRDSDVDPTRALDADSIGSRVTDDGMRAKPHGHVSTEPGVGTIEQRMPKESMGSQLRRLMSPDIPRAPGLPKFTPPADRTPSYIPRRRSTGEFAAPGPIHKISTELQAQAPAVQHMSDLPPAETRRDRGEEPVGTQYSEAPDRPEFVFARQPDPTPAEAPNAAAPPPSASPIRNKSPHRPTSDWPRAARPGPSGHRVPSRPPSAVAHVPGRPSLFEIANLLDESRYEEALVALRELPPDGEHLLMTARALAGAAAKGEAIGVLVELCRVPSLDASLRAGAARLLVDMGRPDLAVAEARQAIQEAPDRPLVRLSLAWAAMRLLHRTSDRDLASEAHEALSGLKGRGGPHPGLVQALRSCIQAYIGDAERAIGVAQRALGLDPRSADALAAIVVASIRLNRVHDAQQSWLRLRELAPEEADALRPQLIAADIEPPSSGPRTAQGFGALDEARTVWPPEELLVLSHDVRRVQAQFESQCRERLDRMAQRGDDEGFPAIAHLAVHSLTEHPVWCHFVPFDLSLWSISRVRAGLSLMYDPGCRLPDDADDFPVVLLLGAYLGQVLCQAHSAHWEGHITDLVNAQVVSVERCWSPFLVVADRFRDGTPIDFGIADDLKLAHPGADEWSEYVAPSVAPPTPWGPAMWPRPTLVPRLGRALSHSAVSEWCRRSASGPLDGSVSSLGALDAYLSLIAPPVARARGDEPWLPRVSVLAGAYLGEVLRATVGGAWRLDNTDSPARSPSDYQLVLGDRQVTPVAEVHARVTGRNSLSLLDYASKLARR